MVKLIKGMIVFFSILLLCFAGLLTYVLVWGTDRLPLSPGNGMKQSRLVKTQALEIDDVFGIVIKNYSSDIFFLKSDSREMVIKEYDSTASADSSFVNVKKADGTLNIQVGGNKKDTWIGFSSNYRFVEIYLPEHYSGKMNITTSSGDIQAMMDFHLDDCLVHASSGDVYFQKMTAENVSITTSSGDIFAEMINGRQKVSTNSGYIEITSSSGDGDFSTSSGDVTLGGVNGDFSFKTSSGYVTADDISGAGRVKTSSGDIWLTFADLAGRLDIESSSGDVYCVLPEQNGFDFQADTSSGTIRTDFDGSLRFDNRERRARGTVGVAGDYMVSVKTSSGDISFKNK